MEKRSNLPQKNSKLVKKIQKNVKIKNESKKKKKRPK